MKGKKSSKITKEMPSAVLLSIVIHAALFLLASMLVVFTVVKKEDQKFVPPQAVERPKMKLRKPKVKVKKTSKPKPTTRIVTKVNRASMPDIQLPEMSGMGDGLAGGVGGFDMMPDFDEVSVFGSGQSIGNDFVGTFYDFKRDRNGRSIPTGWGNFLQAVRGFVRGGWKSSDLARYYRSSKQLYATTFMVSSMHSALAPALFGEKETLGYLWMVHYKGQLVHKDGITFRFRGTADDFIAVRVNGELVLLWPGAGQTKTALEDLWQSSASSSGKYGRAIGDWITLEPGLPLNMEIIFGETPGSWFRAILLVEVQGEEYEKNIRGWPIFPVFKTATLSRDLHEAIHANLVEGLVNLTNGPVFCDYDSSGVSVAMDPVNPEPSVTDVPLEEGEMRSWTRVNGKVFEAEYVALIGTKAVLEDSRGRQRKIPLGQLSIEDQEYIELSSPPAFNINFSKRSSIRILEPTPFALTMLPPKFTDYVFGTALKQTSAGEYNHELKVEFFAIGAEIDGGNYILLDRQESRFTPTKENQKSHSFSGETVSLLSLRLGGNASHMRGQKYGGYLVVVTDKRGEIVAHASPYKWVFKNVDALRKLPIGKHFDKSGTRVFPPRPKREY